MTAFDHDATPKSFPGGCRRFLMRLDELVCTPIPDRADAEHAADCGPCAGRLRAARRHVELLSQLSTPALPAELMDTSAFLAGVHERALAGLETAPWAGVLRDLPAPALPAEMAATAAFLELIHERAVTDFECTPWASRLREALARTERAPGDIAWVQDDGGTMVERPLRDALTAIRSPGWLWARIQAALAVESQPSRVAKLASVSARWGGLLAAAVMVSALLLLHNPEGSSPGQGTSPLGDIVITVSAEPFDSSFSLHSLIQSGR